MTDIETTREQIGNERRHMAATQRAFGQAVQQAADDGRPYGEFYGACVDFLDFIMERFHAQDQSHMDTIMPLRETFSQDDQALLDDLQETFVRSRSEIDQLVAAMKRFREEGPTGQKAFEEAGRKYADYYSTILSKRRHSIRHLVDPNYTPEQYQEHSFITDETIRREKELFSRVEETVPADVTLEVIFRKD